MTRNIEEALARVMQPRGELKPETRDALAWLAKNERALEAALPAYSIKMSSVGPEELRHCGFSERELSPGVLWPLIEKNLMAHAIDNPGEYVFHPGHVGVAARYYFLNLSVPAGGIGHKFMPGNHPSIGAKDHVYAGPPDAAGRMTTFCGMLVTCKDDDPLAGGKCPACIRVMGRNSMAA